MTDFDALLKRSFAEAPEPADDGFSVRVGAAVDKRERMAKAMGVLNVGGTLVGALAAAWGGLMIVQGAAPEVLATLGLELARAHGAVSASPSVNLSAMAGGLSQFLLVMGSLAGGVLVYRNNQQQQ